MGKHLSKYQTQEDYNNNKDNHLKPHVSLIVNPVEQIIFIPEPSYINQYFTIVALEDGLIAQLSVNTCEYCIDNGSWNTLPANSNTPTINKGQTLSFKCNLTKSGNCIGTFNINKKCSVQGNIMSLLFGDNFIEQTDLTGYSYAFYRLFRNCNTLTNANELILPATTLASNCYAYMFRDCTSLTTAPELPATILASGCYSNMFSGCTNLTTAPELPATTLDSNCYYCMFSACTSLTTAPELPATTLASNCYSQMFYGCTSLTTAPELPATTLDSNCYQSMFSNCSKLNNITMLATDISAKECLYYWVNNVSSSGTFIKHPSMTKLSTGISGIPSGWTVKDYSQSA